MSKIKLLFISIFSLLFILQACKRDNPCEGMDPSDKVYNYNIPDSNKTKIPYTGDDTLIFVSNTGDTATLIGQGKDDYFESTRKLTNGGGDCPKYAVSNYENVDLFYEGNNSINILKYKVYLSEDVVGGLTGFNISINDKISSLYNFEYSSNLLYPEDSILYKNKYATGKYLNLNKSILYNKNVGILKFTIYNKTWIKI